jgi:GH24 family phage-related lysozyme (muramidase)
LKRNIPDCAVHIIERFEGLSLETYKCPGGKLTIGYGHTGDDVFDGLVISEAVAEDLLRKDMETAAADVLRLVTAPLSDNEFGALISFTFNLGAGNLESSTLLKLINQHKYAEAADQFPRWVFAGGKRLNGLVSRRNAERDLFLMKGL